MDEEEYCHLLKEFEKLPEYIAEKKRLYYERQDFLEKTMGDLYRDFFEKEIEPLFNDE